MADYLHLKNGTDVRGTAIAGVKGDPVTLTDSAVLSIAAGFCIWVKEKLGKTPTIAVGHDSRLSAERLSALTARGIASQGAKSSLRGFRPRPRCSCFCKTTSARTPRS